MNAVIFSIHFASLALGAGSALIIDLFFVTSSRTRILSTREIKKISRLNLSAIICVVIALVTDVSIISFEVLDASAEAFSYWLLKLLLLSIIFLTGIALRRIYLPELIRHQKHNAHLSDSMILHSTSLVSTVIVSTVTWITAILATTYEFVATEGRAPTALSFLILYCIALYLSVKFFVFLKDHITKRHH